MNNRATTTDRGINFELEVLSHDYNSVHVLVTCEEGSESFDIKLPFRIEENDEVHTMIMNHDLSWFEDVNLSEVYTWVDQKTASFIASEAAKLCVRNSINNEYHCFKLNTISRFSIEITSMEFENQVIGHVIDHRTAYGEEKIKELLNEIKYNN